MTPRAKPEAPSETPPRTRARSRGAPCHFRSPPRRAVLAHPGPGRGWLTLPTRGGGGGGCNPRSTSPAGPGDTKRVSGRGCRGGPRPAASRTALRGSLRDRGGTCHRRAGGQRGAGPGRAVPGGGGRRSLNPPTPPPVAAAAGPGRCPRRAGPAAGARARGASRPPPPAAPGHGAPPLPQTSTKASVRSLARSITGKWRPATILTFSFPGIFLRLPPAAGRKQQRVAHGAARHGTGEGGGLGGGGGWRGSGRACATASNGLRLPAHARRRCPDPAPQRNPAGGNGRWAHALLTGTAPRAADKAGVGSGDGSGSVLRPLPPAARPRGAPPA